MGKELKTNAMRFLDKSKIEYTVQTYECDEFIDGIHTAEKHIQDSRGSREERKLLLLPHTRGTGA